jgi:hypothetical protein
MSTNRFITLVNGVRQFVTAIGSSAGAGDANKIVANRCDRAPASFADACRCSSSTVTIVASEALATGDFVNIWNNAGTRSVRKADASNSRPAHGFVLSSVANAANATVYQQGENTGLTGLTPGQGLFLSAASAGTATATAPSTVGHIVQELGFALSATSICLNTIRPPRSPDEPLSDTGKWGAAVGKSDH